jgi:hypothetical protein
MIRTRDFLLFILTLVFLGVAITYTIKHDGNDVVLVEPVFFTESEDGFQAMSPDHSVDRQANIERLRQKIAQSSQKIDPFPSVQSPEIKEVFATSSMTALQKCPYPDDALSLVPKWPFATVQTKVENGQRVYYVTNTQDVSTVSGTTTVTKKETVTQVVLKVPVSPVVQGKPACVPSEVIGVTPNGLLIFNSSVATYEGRGPESFIGYARDGYPIYGMYKGQTDACGGYDNGSGYRYSLATDRNFIIGCYVATPAEFNL